MNRHAILHRDKNPRTFFEEASVSRTFLGGVQYRWRSHYGSPAYRTKIRPALRKQLAHRARRVP